MGRICEMIRTKSMDGAMLKWIAIITMLIDHIGATIVLEILKASNYAPYLFALYTGMRVIGRIAFPIFCFLLVEGIFKTSNKVKYIVRLGIFALLSEIPFDLSIFRTMFDFEHQNVFFTLLIGVVAISICEKIRENEKLIIVMKTISYVATCFAGMVLAWFLKTDYSAFGVFLILVLYFVKYKTINQNMAGVLAIILGSIIFSISFTEFFAIAAFYPISMYNGIRGMQNKWIFYIFYPAHLFVLYIIVIMLCL
ncbi:MAG: TraX family protein [Lachnospiraceae bacterium]